MEPKANVRRNATSKEPEPAANLTPVHCLKALAGMLLCFWFVWVGVSHVHSMPVDGLYFVAWFGVIFFGAVGVQCARVVIRGTLLVTRNR